MTREEVFEKVSQKMSELFDIDRSTIKPESRFQDLELTSLDAIDLVELREIVIEAWRMCVPKSVAATVLGAEG